MKESGEKVDACGTGTLKTFEEVVKSKGYTYACYDIITDAGDITKKKKIAQCVADIIKTIQAGTYVAMVSKWLIDTMCL